MSYVPAIIKLIEKNLEHMVWLEPILNEIKEKDIKEIKSFPQTGLIKDFDRVLEQHSKSVIKSGIKVLGLLETLSNFNKKSLDDTIWSYGFSSNCISLLVEPLSKIQRVGIFQ